MEDQTFFDLLSDFWIGVWQTFFFFFENWEIKQRESNKQIKVWWVLLCSPVSIVPPLPIASPPTIANLESLFSMPPLAPLDRTLLCPSSSLTIYHLHLRLRKIGAQVMPQLVLRCNTNIESPYDAFCSENCAFTASSITHCEDYFSWYRRTL
jgi:hypothetical protein